MTRVKNTREPRDRETENDSFLAFSFFLYSSAPPSPSPSPLPHPRVKEVHLIRELRFVTGFTFQVEDESP